MKKFDEELERLRNRLVQMGATAQDMVTMSIAALKNLDAVYKKILEAEDRLDQMQLEIDHEAVRLLTVYSPVATDLRFVLSCSHVNAALERMGDQALSICHNLEFAGKHAPKYDKLMPEIHKMGELVPELVRNALLAYVGEDLNVATTVMAQDDLIDSLNDKVITEMLSDRMNRTTEGGAPDVAGALVQILVARGLERIGDQATNICEEVVYMVRGADIRHSSEAHPGRAAKSTQSTSARR